MLAIYSPGLCACPMPTLRPQKEEGICRETFFRGVCPIKLVLFRQEQKTPAEPATLETRRLYAGRFVRGSIRKSGKDFKLQVLMIDDPVNFCGLISVSDTIPKFLRELIPSQDAGDSSFRIC